MAIVGVAGGNGSLGRAVVEAIKTTGKHEVKILGRKSDPTLEAEIGVPIVVVDYTNVIVLKDALERNEIECVISTLNTASSDAIPPEIMLIRAANKSTCTKRFVPSNWTISFKEEWIPPVPAKLLAISELSRSNLEYTVFYCGLFLDYLGFNGIKSYLPPSTLVMDLPHNMAAIPGDGDTPIVVTNSSDIAKYVAASRDLPVWDKESYVIGDKITWQEIVGLA